MERERQPSLACDFGSRAGRELLSAWRLTFDQDRMKMSDKVLWILFVAATVSPILALSVKPPQHSFYMFLPATPDTATGQWRLIAGNIILVAGFAVGLLASATLAWRGLRKKRPLSALCLIVVLANPFHQPIFLEAIDTRANYRWRDRAEQMGIVGKTPEEIRRLIGKPSYEWTETPKTIDRTGKMTWEGETYTGWDYNVLPFYWMGSKFQIFFVDGKVRNFEANDD